MSMMNRDTIFWTKTTKGASDDLGHPSEVPATGYPKDLIGYFSHRGSSGSQNRAGVGQTIDAAFYSETFTDGEQGDLVTFKDVTYRVANIEPKYKVGNQLDHVRYLLTVRKHGTEENGV